MSYTAQDFKKGQPRWCPGCGDHFFLASLHTAMAEIGVAPEHVAVISGIGCASLMKGCEEKVVTTSRTPAWLTFLIILSCKHIIS